MSDDEDFKFTHDLDQHSPLTRSVLQRSLVEVTAADICNDDGSSMVGGSFAGAALLAAQAAGDADRWRFPERGAGANESDMTSLEGVPKKKWLHCAAGGRPNCLACADLATEI